MSNRVLRPKFKPALMAGAAVMAMTTSAIAQEVKPEEEDVIVLDPISIDAKADVITGGVQIEEEALDRIAPETVRDVFRQESGVSVSSPLGISQQIHVNGIEDTNLTVDIDGARQANKTYHHIGTTVMDPGMLKAVKVETGVAPADAGPNALAGTISMETKDGRDYVAPGDNFGGFGKISYNSNTNGFSNDLALATRYEGFDALIYGTKSTGENYEDGRGTEVQGTKPAMENFLLKTGFTADSGYRVKFSATRFEDSAVRPPRPDFDFNTSTTQSPIDYDRANYTLSFGDETPTDMWDPKITLAHTKTSLRMSTGLPFGGFTAFDLKADVDTWNGKASNTFTTELGKYTVGLDFYSDRGRGGRSGYDGTEKAKNMGAFAQARLNVLDDLRTSFGGRIDRSTLKGNDDSSHSAAGLSGNANIEYDVTDQVMLYSGASSTFGGYQLGEIGLFNATATYTDMDPSRAYNYKIGSVYEQGPVTIDGNWYLTRIDDAHDLGDSNRNNHATVHSRGWNLSAKYTYEDGFARLGLSTNNLRVNGGYLVSTSADYTGMDTGESITFEWEHTLRDYNLALGTTNEAMLPDDSQTGVTGSALDGYLVSNIYANWMPEAVEGLSLRFDVNNLFDHQYTNRMNIAVSSTRANSTPFYEPGRSFILTAKYDF